MQSNNPQNRISPIRTTAVAATNQTQNTNNLNTSARLEEIKQRLKNSGYRNKNQIREGCNMSQYSPYLFYSPMNEEYISDEDIIEYLNENYTYDEINDIYNQFLIETFGYDILNEDYYNYIVDQYGEETLLEGLWGNIKSALGFGGSAQPTSKPQTDRNHWEQGHKPINNILPKSPIEVMRVRQPNGEIKSTVFTGQQAKTYRNWVNSAKKAESERKLKLIAAASQADMDRYHERKKRDKEWELRKKYTGKGW